LQDAGRVEPSSTLPRASRTTSPVLFFAAGDWCFQVLQHGPRCTNGDEQFDADFPGVVIFEAMKNSTGEG
jgi:hypothetical protein